MVAMVWPGTKTVTARSLNGCRSSAMGSLTISAPAGISTVGWPWKSAGMAVPLMAPPVAARAMLAPPIFRAVAPKALLRTIRRLGPPIDTWTISRRVVSSEKWLSVLPAEDGAADHVPTQWASDLLALAEVVAMNGISSNDARKWRDVRRIVRAIWCQVY